MKLTNLIGCPSAPSVTHLGVRSSSFFSENQIPLCFWIELKHSGKGYVQPLLVILRRCFQQKETNFKEFNRKWEFKYKRVAHAPEEFLVTVLHPFIYLPTCICYLQQINFQMQAFDFETCLRSNGSSGHRGFHYFFAAFLRLKIYVCVEITVIGSWTGIVGAFKNYLPQICGAFWHGLRALVLDNTWNNIVRFNYRQSLALR